MKFTGQGFPKIRARTGQTDRHRDATERITIHHIFHGW